MAAPTVTRPAAVVDDPKSGQGSGPGIDWAQHARRFVIGAVVLGVGALIYTWVVSYQQSSRRTALSKQWEEYHRAMDKKETDEELIPALEGLCENPAVKGSAVHGTSLMQLALRHMEMAQSPRRQPESRAAALDRAAAIYELVATTEPFKSNPSFGPLALSNWAAVYEQQQTYTEENTDALDKAIKTLQGALYTGDSKEPEPVGAIRTHFLFDKMTAQIGRMYWLRGQIKEETVQSKVLTQLPIALWPYYIKTAKFEANKADYDMARYFLKRALDAGVPQFEIERMAQINGKASWRKEAAYLKALLDPPGKLLPDGVPPPVRPEAPPATETPGANAPNTTAPTDVNARATDTKTPDKAKAVEAKAPDAKAPDAKAPETKAPEKKDEPKAPEKKEPEKKEAEKKGQAGLQQVSEPLAADEDAPQKHISYAQMQAMLKQGKSAFCLCPRCDITGKPIGAKLLE